MDKMKMETANKTLENLAKLKEMFPEVITESKDENGEIVAAVDAKKLEQLLSTKVIEGDECYDFTWVGKKQAMIEACKPIRKTLRPCRKESVDWENTQNLYIEGDNLDVLKLLQESYLNKVKMIYIDPPYNTGNDSFIYPDDYSTNKELYDEEVGAIDESGYRMFKNTETNGRFHSSWCSMMYPRLKLARNLLTEDGVIFISIDDNEVDNMRKMCDEIFGEGNFIAQFVWQKKSSGGQHANNVLDFHEYILAYTKNIHENIELLVNRNEKQKESFTLSDEHEKKRGKYLLSPLKSWLDYRPTLIYDIVCPDGSKLNTQWVCAETTYKQLKDDDRIVFKQNQKGEWSIYKKQYSEENGGLVKPASIITEYGQTQNGKRDIKELFDGFDVMSFPKPVKLLKYLISMLNKDSIILDFFSGSATTAHAVMQLNADDDGKRKFIMVQLPEICDENSEAYKAGYKNICEIGKERIRRAGKKIVEETGKKDLDIGFRVLKLDESNMKDVYYTPDKITQESLLDQIDNIKDDRNGYDLLYACMLEWGIELSLSHKIENIDGFEVHNVNDGDLVACFDKNITDEVIRKIAKKKPLRVVFRDSSFATDANKTNMKEIFKLEFPELDNEGLKRKVKIL